MEKDVFGNPLNAHGRGYKMLNNSPHNKQGEELLLRYNETIQYTRKLSREYPREKYRRRKGELKTVIHWGQRKLLLSEIEFLTPFAENIRVNFSTKKQAPVSFVRGGVQTEKDDDEDPTHPASVNAGDIEKFESSNTEDSDGEGRMPPEPISENVENIENVEKKEEELEDATEPIKQIVVYAGAAPGTHIQYLAELFPEFHFELYDPAPFTVKDSENITTHQVLFTDEVAKLYSGKNVLFICDIRAVDWQMVEEEETDAQIRIDMDDQQRWHEIMNPRKSMLKFRLSWNPGKTLYLDGEIYFPIYGPITTTESRLMVNQGAGKKEYDNTEYEEQMFYFNTKQRVGYYPHNVNAREEGLDYCYDCTSEVLVLRDYLLKRGMSDENEIAEEIQKMICTISLACSSNRHLRDPNPDPGKRKDIIKKNQYIEGQPAYLVAKRRIETDTDEEYNSHSNKAPRPVDYGKGQHIIRRMGYVDGKGLGAEESGRRNPLDPSGNKFQRGVGYTSNVSRRIPEKTEKTVKDCEGNVWTLQVSRKSGDRYLTFRDHSIWISDVKPNEETNTMQYKDFKFPKDTWKDLSDLRTNEETNTL